MARARNIKPAIMDNEELAELPPLTRLLFIYLWMLADREGRLEDRPKRIAAQALPYDRSADAEVMLSELEKAGFITRYEAAGARIIQVLNFAKHQTPHIREAASELPEQEQGTNKEVTKHSLGSAQASPRSPDSLIPDSLIPEEDMAETGLADFVPPSAPADANSVQTSQPVDACPHKDIVALFAEVLPSARQVRDWTPARQQLLRARWREDKKRQDLAWWRRFFTYVGQSDFLMGRSATPGRKPFELGLEWLLKSENFAKVREGAYHEAEATA